MKKAIIFTFAVITLTPIVTYAVSMWCPKFSAELLGELQVMGNIYRERLLVYKVSAGEGYEGLWKIDLFASFSKKLFNVIVLRSHWNLKNKPLSAFPEILFRVIEFPMQRNSK